MRVAINGEWLDNLYPTYDNVIAAVALIHRKPRRLVSAYLGLVPCPNGGGYSIYYGNKGIGFITRITAAERRALAVEMLNVGMRWGGIEYRRGYFRSWYYHRKASRRYK